MTREEWRRIKQIAHDALGRPAYVEAQCDGDTALCGEVLSLVESADRAEHLFETPAFTTAGLLTALGEADSLQPSFIGRRIGAYRIVSELGRGGMGAAYLA